MFYPAELCAAPPQHLRCGSPRESKQVQQHGGQPQALATPTNQALQDLELRLPCCDRGYALPEALPHQALGGIV